METIKGERTEGASFWDACAKTSDRENAELENYHNILTLNFLAAGSPAALFQSSFHRL